MPPFTPGFAACHTTPAPLFIVITEIHAAAAIRGATRQLRRYHKYRLRRLRAMPAEGFLRAACHAGMLFIYAAMMLFSPLAIAATAVSAQSERQRGAPRRAICAEIRA